MPLSAEADVNDRQRMVSPFCESNFMSRQPRNTVLSGALGSLLYAESRSRANGSTAANMAGSGSRSPTFT